MKQFNLHERLQKACDTLGFEEPTKVQQAAIPEALTGKDMYVIAQTGSGKTAAFLIPLLQQWLNRDEKDGEIRALILLPTRELARQIQEQFEALAQFTFAKAMLLTGGEPLKRQQAELRRRYDVIIATPGRLVEHIEQGTVWLDKVETVVYDEADRMMDFGFAEDLKMISKACQGNPQTLMFSATTGGKALSDTVKSVLNEPKRLFINSRDQLSATTIQQVITSDHTAHKTEQTLALCKTKEYRRAIIFTNTRDGAERLYGKLANEDGIKVYIIHGEKDHKARKETINRFSSANNVVLIATDVAARGLDVDGLDMVINYDMPRKGDDYVHRIGRTGRNGEQGLAISLITHLDWNLMISIERYLKQKFELSFVEGLKARYQGPKNVKASGKAVGKKKKPGKKGAIGKNGKPVGKKPTGGKRPSGKHPEKKPKRQVEDGIAKVSNDGSMPLRRRKKPE